MKTLALLLGGLFACSSSSRTDDQAGACYRMVWRDSGWSGLLPATFRLAKTGARTRITRSKIPGEDGPYPILPVQLEGSPQPSWAGLTGAQWYQLSPDSVYLGFESESASWGGALRVVGDTIAGSFSFSGFNQDGNDRSVATGVKVVCAR